MKLKGTPWWSSDGATVIHARMLACTLLSAMEASGFELVGSVDMSMGQGGDENHDRESRRAAMQSDYF